MFRVDNTFIYCVFIETSDGISILNAHCVIYMNLPHLQTIDAQLLILADSHVFPALSLFLFLSLNTTELQLSVPDDFPKA